MTQIKDLPFQIKCIVCNFDRSIIQSSNDIYHYNCPRCGEYAFTRRALINFNSDKKKQDFSKNKLLVISNYIYHKFQYPTIITEEYENSLIEVQDKNPVEKLNNLLISLQNKIGLTSINEFDQTDQLNLEVESWLCGNNEYLESLKILEQDSFITFKNYIDDSIVNIKLTSKAHNHIELLKKNHKIKNVKDKVFIAMCFDGTQKLKDLSNLGIKPAIIELGFEPIKVNEIKHIELIDNKIIEQIRECRFMVADLTENRGGVYFEAGYAKALDIPVFFTCQNGQINTVHFDVNHYNILEWDNDKLIDFKENLKDLVKQVLHLN
jgi:predicted RNA-binding Zn-ribbon protein involved in translation (DUF1610 family)